MIISVYCLAAGVWSETFLYVALQYLNAWSLFFVTNCFPPVLWIHLDCGACFPVYADGSICLDILQNRWSPTYDVSSILTSIQVGGSNCLDFLIQHICTMWNNPVCVCVWFVLHIVIVPYRPQSLLDEPNPNSPANSQAAQLYQENKREYEKRVTAIVEQSWVDVWLASLLLSPPRHHPTLIFTSSRKKQQLYPKNLSAT